MKTSATETRLIDSYLLGQMPPADKLVFDAKLMLCPELQQTADCQQKVHQLVKLRGRQKLKARIQEAEQKVFSQPEYSGFRQRVWRLFNRL
ncbi:hypothetical protein [Mucilaginibacter sp. PAMB04168]|uniref:hypothetical protein n=1 Tax=Mucilaginibacter sp. PAMB04168 TaxID=3138567 RepID=UPI0031F60429